MGGGKALTESLEKCVLARPLNSEPGKWSHVLLLAILIFCPAWGPSLLLAMTLCRKCLGGGCTCQRQRGGMGCHDALANSAMSQILQQCSSGHTSAGPGRDAVTQQAFWRKEPWVSDWPRHLMLAVVTVGHALTKSICFPALRCFLGHMVLSLAPSPGGWPGQFPADRGTLPF